MTKKVTVWPKSTEGIWAIILFLLTPTFFCLSASLSHFYKNIESPDSIMADILIRPGISLPALSGMATAMTSLLVGLVAFLKRHDRSLLLLLPVALGLVIFTLLIGEILFPH